MPRNVRNFWVELDVDGRSPIASGPVKADGGFHITIKQRGEGHILEALNINGHADKNGSLTLWVNGDLVLETKR